MSVLCGGLHTVNSADLTAPDSATPSHVCKTILVSNDDTRCFNPDSDDKAPLGHNISKVLLKGLQETVSMV